MTYFPYIRWPLEWKNVQRFLIGMGFWKRGVNGLALMLSLCFIDGRINLHRMSSSSSEYSSRNCKAAVLSWISKLRSRHDCTRFFYHVSTQVSQSSTSSFWKRLPGTRRIRTERSRGLGHFDSLEFKTILCPLLNWKVYESEYYCGQK